jgi:trans-2,3-dihydro-3-hydroxyanthranilate isomerase
MKSGQRTWATSKQSLSLCSLAQYRRDVTPIVLPYTLLDVFTDTPLQGNGLAVVHDADSLDDETMQQFARETRLSETTFVQTPDAIGADYRNRIWTVMEEVPFAGHPSLGTAVAVAHRRGEYLTRYVQQTRSGLQPIEVRLDGTRASASMLQPPANLYEEVDRSDALAAVGLEAEDAHARLVPQVVSTGLTTLLVLVGRRQAVAQAVPNFPAIDALLGSLDAYNLYLAWPDPDGENVHARMFTRNASEGEDPATGSAAGPLCAYLGKRMGWSRLKITQGVEMGRPSRLRAEVDENGIRVGGDVVLLIEGTLTLDT